MIIKFNFLQEEYTADLSKPLDISIPLKEGEDNPNCYYAGPVKFETIRSGGFVGSVREGGSVNYQKITLTPHGNGTHSECFGHISNTGHTINKALKKFHFVAELVSVEPEKTDDDEVIKENQVLSRLKHPQAEAVIIRTLPNGHNKLNRKYSGTNPPYFEAGLFKALIKRGVSHFLTDLPSVDREVDEGKLLAHRAFWNMENNNFVNSTITELVFIDDEIKDGLYLLNIQIPSLEIDAAPSKPVLYELIKIN